jgi:hypothetical protein
MSNTMRNVIVAALLGITAGCGGTSPVAPAVVTPVVPVAPAAPVGTYTLTPSASAVVPGGQLNVSWTASIKGGNDWIALFKKGDSTLAPISDWVGWTDGATAGTFTISAPALAGQYEFRYFLNDGWAEAARSSVVTVF